jgi:hypothetical protein
MFSLAKSIRLLALSYIEKLYREENISPLKQRLVADMERSAMVLDNIISEAEKKKALGVFGASQTGKSSLVRDLLKSSRNGALLLDFQGEVIDFGGEYNPPGGQGRVGVITRFSKDSPPLSNDKNLPVYLKLLTETEIIKILSESFFYNYPKKVDISDSDINAIILQFEKKFSFKKNLPPIDWVRDIIEFVSEIRNVEYLEVLLKSRYFEMLNPLCGGLEIGDRAVLLSYLWGQVPELTRMYELLYKALLSLDFPEAVFTELKAVRSERCNESGQSILDSGVLDGFFDEKNDSVEVMAANSNNRARIDIPILSALTAEIYAKARHSESFIIEKIDVLDFPGLEAGDYFPQDGALDKKQAIKNFVISKVIILFKRFSKSGEMSTLIICSKNSNEENPFLATLVNDWTRQNSVFNRKEEGAIPNLFMVLTFMNSIIIKSKFADDPLEFWNNLFENTLFGSFKKYDWFENWSDGGLDKTPFNNLLMKMDVAYGNHTFNIKCVNEKNQYFVSDGIKDDQKEIIEKIRKAYLNSSTINLRVKNPVDAWNAAVLSSDGGTEYLIYRLMMLLDSKYSNTVDMDLIKKELEIIVSAITKLI